MFRLKDLSIRRKLNLVAMLTSGVALLVACAAFVAYDIVAFREGMARDLSATAGIVGANSTASLTFKDPKAADEILSALRARQRVVSACIYTNEGKVFARYLREPDREKAFPASRRADGGYFEGRSLVLFRGIVLDGERIGTVYLESDLQELDARLRRYAGILAAIGLGAMLASLLLSSKLQRVISGPILRLAETMKAVSEKKDYSIRAVQDGRDELGLLIEGFNGMLAQVQDRDERLQQHRERLEEVVAARTASLESTNRALEGQIAERLQAEEKLSERARLAALGAEVGVALTQSDSLQAILQRCTEFLVKHLDAAFARIWTLNERENVLELEASAGMYTHIDGAHGRVPVGQFKIGLIAQERRPHLTNQVIGDPRVGDQAWARREGMVAFAGYPLIVGDRLVGVMAMFARHPLTSFTLDALGAVADGIALGIERMQAEKALRKSEERTRLIVETSHDAFIAMNAEGLIVAWNAQAEATFGWSHQEAIGRSLAATIVPPPYREAHEQGLRRFLATGQGPVLNRRIEITALHRDGREFPVEMTISPLRVGETYTFNAFVHDITERKRAEETLHRAKEAAEEASRAKSEFLANMSHEIRTPMNGILGMTELALDTGLNSEQREYLETVKASADSLLLIINDILDFSKIEAGRLELERIDFSLSDSVGEAMKALAVRAHQKGLELAYYVSPDVPDALVGDPGRLRQILINLVGNAIKFTEKGEVVVEVEKQGSGVRGQGSGEARSTDQVEGERGGPDPRPPIPDTCFLHFSVRDTGIGIPKEKQEAIFHAFEQVDGSTTRKYGGTGLGLTISAQLVEMMGGQVWVESEVGKGSIFHFAVRLDLSETPTVLSAPVELVDLRGKSVLVVDDNATNRRILEAMLIQWGMQTTVVDSGLAALGILKRAREAGRAFDLMVLDAMMPEMDGFTLAEEIQKDPAFSEITLMMLTSAGLRGDAARCRDLGITTYLMKPITQSDLLDAIMTTLGVRILGETRPSLITRHSLRANRQASEEAASRGVRILLAEDNAVNQRLAVRLLEKRGHAVTVANNGKEAVDALARQAFDLVLMDVQMPEMGGFEATDLIRQKERQTGGRIPIIALTAHAMKGDREKCLEAGMDDYVTKPIRAEELFRAMERLLSASQGAGGGASAEEETPEGSFDRAAALKRLEGDEDLLREIAGMFREDCPGLLSEIREAIDSGDAPRLRHAAHALKGAVGNFSAKAAFLAALRLEMIGEGGDLSSAAEAFAALEAEVERLAPALESLEKENVP